MSLVLRHVRKPPLSRRGFEAVLETGPWGRPSKIDRDARRSCAAERKKKVHPQSAAIQPGVRNARASKPLCWAQDARMSQLVLRLAESWVILGESSQKTKACCAQGVTGRERSPTTAWLLPSFGRYSQLGQILVPQPMKRTFMGVVANQNPL